MAERIGKGKQDERRKSLIEVWKNLPTELIEKVEEIDAGNVADIARLRKKYSAEQVAAGIGRVKARAKARAKFPDHWQKMIAEPAAMEQASSIWVGRHKAKRFADYLKMEGNEGKRVCDLCCGIGGDMIALNEVCEKVVGFEMDKLRAWMCEVNTGGEVVVGDVTKQELVGEVFHIDPARRESGKRIWNFEDILPSPTYLEELVEKNEAGCIKLAPSVDQEDLPFDCELEYVSENGRMVQGIAWTGGLDLNERTATMIRKEKVVTLSGEVDDDLYGYVEGEGKYLFAVDPTIERADLMGELAEELKMGIVHPRLGLYTGDRLVESEWLRGFEVVETLPWKEGRVKGWLREHDSGIVEVKTRGKVVNPDVVQPQLSGKGNEAFTVFVLRKHKAVVCYITKRI